MQWRNPSSENAGSLASLHLSPLIAGVLLRRGIRDTAAAQAFLHPETVAAAPFPGMDVVADLLLAVAKQRQPICVWGDFDADGQTSTSLLVDALRMIGAEASFHVPVRSVEGHGLQIPTLKGVLDGGVRVVLTCDTGITAHEAVAYANSRASRVLITDHHDPDKTLPPAEAVINPKLLSSGNTWADLSGVGVAYKLAEAVLLREGISASTLLDLVALGLIADVAALRSGTRELASRGIDQLRATRRLGLQMLAEQAQVDLANANEETISFALAPRLNALGRLGDANLGVELMLSTDPVRTRVLAAQIESLNSQRKLLTDQVYHAVEERLSSEPSILAGSILILEHNSWPAGVLGIVASRLVERYHKPAILLSRNDGELWRGSARSIEGLNISQAIASHRDMLVNFGGHPMAAGLSMAPEHLPRFRVAIQETVDRLLAAAKVEEGFLQIDAWLSLGELSLGLAEELEQLAPFGAGNPAPVLATKNVRVTSTKQLGHEQEHSRLVFVDEAGARAEVLWWGSEGMEIPDGTVDIAYSLRSTVFRGERKLALTLNDFRVKETSPVKLTQERIELIDLRKTGTPVLPPECLVWSEGTRSAGGLDRYQLRASTKLAIWTSPPGAAELRAAIALVQPRIIYVVGRRPDVPDAPEDLLRYLAGMVRFVVRQHRGKTTLSRMSASCAQRELTTRIGLEWMAASGHIQLQVHGGELQIAETGAGADALLTSELMAGFRSVLDETAAYRRHFSTADLNSLIQRGSIPSSS